MCDSRHSLDGMLVRSTPLIVRNPFLLSFLFAISACGVDRADPVSGGDGVGPMDPVMAAEVVVSPGAFEAHVVDGGAVAHAYTAMLVTPDGVTRDITDQVTFSVADPRFGAFHGPILMVGGEGAGVTRVIATYGVMTGEAPVTVYVAGTRTSAGAPVDGAAMFGAATAAHGCAPVISYPAARTVVPANLGALDVHWTDAVHDVFAVRAHNTYVDLTYITTSPSWMTIDADWPKFETSHDAIAIEVSGMTAATPATKCVAAARTIEVTRDDARGGVYYWSTDWIARAAGATGQDIMRFDLAKPEVAPAPMFTDATRPAACVGCHALSRDGKRIAMTMDSSTGRGSVIDLPTNRQLMPTDASAPRWSSAVFTPDGEKLIAVENGQMRLIFATGGQTITTIPNTAGTIAGYPEISPDGTKLVNVETTGADDWAFGDASIVVRSFDSKTNTFGAATMVMPFDATAGVQSYYPSWSPDGVWIAVTRSTRTRTPMRRSGSPRPMARCPGSSSARPLASRTRGLAGCPPRTRSATNRSTS